MNRLQPTALTLAADESETDLSTSFTMSGSAVATLQGSGSGSGSGGSSTPATTWNLVTNKSDTSATISALKRGKKLTKSQLSALLHEAMKKPAKTKQATRKSNRRAARRSGAALRLSVGGQSTSLSAFEIDFSGAAGTTSGAPDGTLKAGAATLVFPDVNKVSRAVATGTGGDLTISLPAGSGTILLQHPRMVDDAISDDTESVSVEAAKIQMAAKDIKGNPGAQVPTPTATSGGWNRVSNTSDTSSSLVTWNLTQSSTS